MNNQLMSFIGSPQLVEDFIKMLSNQSNPEERRDVFFFGGIRSDPMENDPRISSIRGFAPVGSSKSEFIKEIETIDAFLSENFKEFIPVHKNGSRILAAINPAVPDIFRSKMFAFMQGENKSKFQAGLDRPEDFDPLFKSEQQFRPAEIINNLIEVDVFEPRVPALMLADPKMSKNIKFITQTDKGFHIIVKAGLVQQEDIRILAEKSDLSEDQISIHKNILTPVWGTSLNGMLVVPFDPSRWATGEGFKFDVWIKKKREELKAELENIFVD